MMKNNAGRALALLAAMVMAIALVAGAEEAGEPRRSDRLIAAGYHSVGILPDGTVTSAGWNREEPLDLSGWTQIVSVAAGDMHTVGLRADGTVLAAGSNEHGQCAVEGWTQIVAIAAGANHTIGVRADGTVVACGLNDAGQCDVSGWTDVIDAAAGAGHTLGLRRDGTVVAVGANHARQCLVEDWTDVVKLDAIANHSIGLRADGSVLLAGAKSNGVSVATGWRGIADVALCEGYVAGLREDGRLYLGGKDSWGIGAAASWTDIIAIEGGRCHLLGLKADGTVLATGLRDAGQCDVEEWILRQPPVSAATTPAPTKPAGQGSAHAPQATPTPAPQMTQTPVPEADPTPTPAPYATPAPTTTPEPTPYVTPEPRPIWERVPGYEMPVTDAEVAKDVELKFVGILNIPALNVKLPIQSTWSYEQLAYTPCRYAGSCYSDGFVIIAHRFDSHFAGIGSLTPGTMITFTDMNGNVFRYNVVAVETLRGDQNEELLSKDYAMSLMTCTLSSSQRIVVRCERD